MSPRLWLTTATAVVVAAALALPADAYQRPGVTERVSVSSSGAQGDADTSLADHVAMTPSGRYVAFASAASNLVRGDTSGSVDVFVRDLANGRTTMASVASDGSHGHALPVLCGDAATAPAISANGRYVAFVSCYDNLVSADTNVQSDVFVHDMKTGRTTRVSVGPNGAQAAGNSFQPTISADGRYVAFMSQAANLDPKTCGAGAEQQLLCQSAVEGFIQGNSRVYVRDLVGKKTKVVSVASNGEPADGQSMYPAISPDGRYVAFTSTADNLAANDHNFCGSSGIYPTCPDVYLHNMASGATELISVGIDGKATTFGADTYNAVSAISNDDRYVAFRASSDNLVPAGRGVGIYVRDRKTDRIRRASTDSSGLQIGMGQGNYALAVDGRYVAFDSAELMSSCMPQPVVVAIHDELTGTVETEDRTDSHGALNGCAAYYNSYQAAASATGRYVAFVTGASNLVAGDTNGKVDLFIRDRGPVLGVGGLVRNGQLAIAATPRFATSGIASSTDPSTDVDGTLTSNGANLVGVTMAYRPATADLFVRLPVARMPMFAVASPALVYGLDLSVGGTAYEVRVAKTGVDASFGLFRRDFAGRWVHVADLRGGYGTTGQEVVFGLPLTAIGAQRGGQLSAVRAFTGLGSYLGGAVQIVDTLNLSG